LKKERRGHRTRLRQRRESVRSRSAVFAAQSSTTPGNALVNKDSNFVDCIPNRLSFVSQRASQVDEVGGGAEK
jgi:hypothetical protein